MSDLEADSNVLRKEVGKLLRVVLQHQVLNSCCLENEKRNSWAHCGRTKVFLTQSMVSHLNILIHNLKCIYSIWVYNP